MTRQVIPIAILFAAITMLGSSDKAMAGNGVVSESCRISLPYKPAEFPECSPKAAAAYDFSFCGVYYITVSLSASRSAVQTEAISQASLKFQKSGTTYLKISEALSDADTLKRNVDLAKQYFEGLVKEGTAFSQHALSYAHSKCGDIENYHVQAGIELTELLRSQGKIK